MQIAYRRFVKGNERPEVYCVVHGRRRLVLHENWYSDFGSIPKVEIIAQDAVEALPLGPACPFKVNGATLDEVLSSGDSMRLYLGSLVAGEGIECGAGNRPMQINLDAKVRYLEAFAYGSNESRSYPGAVRYSGFVPIDIVDKIEDMKSLGDESVDFVIASHVIEHTPNPVGAIAAFRRILRSSGKAILIVPDHDLTFDKPRAITTVEHLMLDYTDYARERDLEHYKEYARLVGGGSPEQAFDDWRSGADMHYHCFTPASFMALVGATSSIIKWRDVRFITPPPSEPGEFYVVLTK